MRSVGRQHSKGVQIISHRVDPAVVARQHRPAWRRNSRIAAVTLDQGSTDIPTLYDILPGYLSMPRGDGSEETLREVPCAIKPNRLVSGIISQLLHQPDEGLLRQERNGRNDFGYSWVPKLTANHSFFEYLYDMADGKMEGMFMMGQIRRSLRQTRGSTNIAFELKWLVVRDMVEIEGATFWYDSPRSSAAN